MANIENSADHRAQNLKEFVPSDPDAPYLKTPEQKKEIAKTSLAELAIVINSTYATGLKFAKQATQEMIKCGEYLGEARRMFKGDKEFGQWRAKNIEFSQSHCQRLMAVAKEFGKNDDAALLPIGTLSELLPASPELKEKVISDVKEGKKVTREDVKKAKKEEKGEPVSPPEGDAEQPVVAGKPIKNKDSKPGPVTHIDPVEEAQHWLDKPFIKRLQGLEVLGKHGDLINAWLIFGIPPYHDGMPSIDLIHSVVHAYAGEIESDGPDAVKLQAAYQMLIDLY